MKVVLSALLFIASACWGGVQTEKITATDLGNGWHEHDQFGTFYDANNSDWYYHLDHGWIYVDEWDDNGTWMYMPLEDSNFTYLNEYFDGADFSPIVEWGSLAESTGLSLEFLQAISSAAGYDLNITSDENKTIHATNTKEPFGWAWTSSSTESFIYNNRLEEWFYYNKERENSDARYYSYTLKRYFSGKDIHKRNLSVDIWREMLTEVGLKLLLQLDFDDSQISSELKNQPSVDSAFPAVMSINIPKAEINEDEFWFPLIGHLTNLKGDLKKFYRLFEDENSYILEVRNGFASYDAVMMEIPEDDEELNEIRTPSVGLSDIAAEAVALERIGLIDLNNNDTIGKVDEYVEVAKQASRKFDEKVKGLNNYGKDSKTFASNLFNNFDDVINVVNEAKDLGTKTDTTMDSLLEDSQNAEFIKELIKIAGEIGAKDKENLRPLFQNADKADELKAVIDVAIEVGAKDRDNLQSVFQNADKALELKQVVDVAAEIGAKDKENLRPLFQNAGKVIELRSVVEATEDLGLFTPKYALPMLLNADKSDSLKKIIEAADEVGLKDKENLAAVFQNADKAVDLKAVIDFAEKYGLKTDTNLREVLQQTDKAEELNELILAETLQTIDDLDKETIQQALQSPTAIAYTLPAAEVLKVSLGELKVIDKDDIAPEIKSITKGIKIGDIDIGVVADIAFSSKITAANIALTEIKDRAEIVQVYEKSGLSGETLSKIIAELKDPTNSFSETTNEKSESILNINIQGTPKWQNAHVTVEGTSLKFSGDASAKGDVVLENVTHSAASDLNSTEFKLYTEQY